MTDIATLDCTVAWCIFLISQKKNLSAVINSLYQTPSYCFSTVQPIILSASGEMCPKLWHPSNLPSLFWSKFRFDYIWQCIPITMLESSIISWIGKLIYDFVILLVCTGGIQHFAYHRKNTNFMSIKFCHFDPWFIFQNISDKNMCAFNCVFPFWYWTTTDILLTNI